MPSIVKNANRIKIIFSDKTRTFTDWIFTDKPQVFGLIPGYAAPTGVGLILILTVMVILSMSFVRNKGHFEVSWIPA